MTIHVNVGDAKARLDELIAAARRGEEVLVGGSGVPLVRLVPFHLHPRDLSEEQRSDIASKRARAIGMWKQQSEEHGGEVPRSMTDEEVDAKARRIFGPLD